MLPNQSQQQIGQKKQNKTLKSPTSVQNTLQKWIKNKVHRCEPGLIGLLPPSVCDWTVENQKQQVDELFSLSLY